MDDVDGEGERPGADGGGAEMHMGGAPPRTRAALLRWTRAPGEEGVGAPPAADVGGAPPRTRAALLRWTRAAGEEGVAGAEEGQPAGIVNGEDLGKKGLQAVVIKQRPLAPGRGLTRGGL